ncbi:SRPBCC domain-containing protein [Vibrio sp. AK197]
MLTLKYQVVIDATPDKIWAVLTEVERYTQWAKAFSPNSQFEGDWFEGEVIAFFDPEFGGTRALVDRIEYHKLIEYHHTGVFGTEHQLDIDTDMARKWIGSREIFRLEPVENGVVLHIQVHTDPAFVSMFNQGWQSALPMIKSLSESSSQE